MSLMTLSDSLSLGIFSVQCGLQLYLSGSKCSVSKNSFCSTSSLHFHIIFKDSRSSLCSTPSFNMPIFKPPWSQLTIAGRRNRFVCICGNTPTRSARCAAARKEIWADECSADNKQQSTDVTSTWWPHAHGRAIIVQWDQVMVQACACQQWLEALRFLCSWGCTPSLFQP